MTASFAPFDAVVFDMDGTLLDTEAVFSGVVGAVARGLGFEFPQALHHALIGVSHERMRTMVEAAFGPTFPYDRFYGGCIEESRLRLRDAVPLKPGARALIEALVARDIPVAVATSAYADYALSSLERAQLLPLFGAVVTRNDVVNPKPHPEPYLMAAGRLGIDPRACLAFEDSHVGVRAAHAAGMRTVMVPDLLRPTDEIAALCHLVLDSLTHAHERMFDPELTPLQ